ncbi:heme exporter protein CcmD [Aestuariibacter sp. AA17]|uniref:Heme exporter protein D n=1 Tax=Fluctibacter corallii TaxID=2984329 RepID=A0ABT3A3Q3_9ALTE|nr:heme exporter protein CcmD [Aestuariibacter sp. AA17]MCV2883304.1 heme exporter protein CcmD [Aestuariibacter sp. AA17]
MHFSSFSDFIAMGGYGFFVWLAFGVSIVAMLMIIGESLYQRKSLKHYVHDEVKRKARIAAMKDKQRSEQEA